MTTDAASAAEVGLLALARRCEAASGPDVQLDVDIFWEVIWDGQGDERLAPRYTASLDAAMTLVPRWLTPTIIGHDREVRLYNGIGGTIRGQDFKSVAADLCRALCAAALRARASQEPQP